MAKTRCGFCRGRWPVLPAHWRRGVPVLCEKNDLISVPAHTPHWFDMGSEPNFTAIRIFDNPEGWIAQFTGDDIASAYPRLA